jgi:hypothetical protein
MVLAMRPVIMAVSAMVDLFIAVVIMAAAVDSTVVADILVVGVADMAEVMDMEAVMVVADISINSQPMVLEAKLWQA